VRRWLAEADGCSDAEKRGCSDACLCEIEQLEGLSMGEPLWQCQNLIQGLSPNVFGFCYVDPSQAAGNDNLAAGCPSTAERGIRFVGGETPSSVSRVFVTCGWQE
jgi:hypothetical protein